MSVGSSSSKIPNVRIGEDDMGEPRIHVYTARDGGILLSGYLENEDGDTLKDPKDNGQAFRLELGIEDWTIALALGADLVSAAMSQRARMLKDIELDEHFEAQEQATSALFNAPEGSEPVI